MVEIVDTYVEEIERALHGHLPQSAINIIARMAEQQRVLERALNDAMGIIEQLRSAMVVSVQSQKILTDQMRKFEKDYSDPHRDIIQSLDIKDSE